MGYKVAYSRNDLLGKNDYDFVPKGQADFFTEKDWEVLRGKDVVDIPEEPLQTVNKGVRTLHTKKVPIMKARRWRRWVCWQAASPTISIMFWALSSAMRNWP